MTRQNKDKIRGYKPYIIHKPLIDIRLRRRYTRKIKESTEERVLQRGCNLQESKEERVRQRGYNSQVTNFVRSVTVEVTL